MSNIQKLNYNLELLKWLRIDELIFAGAIFIAYQMHVIGLSLGQILLGESIFALTIFIFEIPSGVFSDLISRKKTLIASAFILLIGTIVFALATSFGHVIISQIIFGIGLSLSSGTDSAILYETLKSMKNEKQYRQILGDFQFFALLVLACGQIIGGFLADIDLRLVIILCIPIPLIKIFITWQLIEPPRHKVNHPESHPIKHAFQTTKWIFSHRTIFYLLLASAFISLAWKINLHTFNPYMEIVGLPMIYWGLFMAIANIMTAFTAKYAYRIIDKIGEMSALILIFSVQGIAFLLMASFNIFLAFLLPLSGWFVRYFQEVFFSDEFNKRADSAHRATVLSIANFCAQALQMLFLPILGYMADLYTLQTMYFVMFGILAITGMISIVGLRKSFISKSKLSFY